MQSKNYFRISRILFYASVSFICASLLSFFWTLIISSRIYFDPSSNGLKEFVSYYQPQIALAGVGIALFALWITSERMKQTKEQIDVMADNNKFNNFYRHREEFIKYLSSQPFIINLAKCARQNLDDLLLQYHGIYFAKRYDEFEPEINEIKFNDIKLFFRQINNSRELNSGFDETVVSDMPFSLSDQYPDHFFEIKMTIDHLREINPLIDKKLGGKTKKCNCICELCKLYYTCRIMRNILTFAGNEIKIDDYPNSFVFKFHQFLEDSNLSKLRLD